MNMEKFKVESIKDMIYKYPKIDKDGLEIIVITRQDYDYNFVPLIKLEFDDILKEDIIKMDSELKKKFIFVNKKHIDSIIKKLPRIIKAKTVYVCCDAGLSRSPAVAIALAYYLGESDSYTKLSWKHPFCNKDVFETVLIGLQKFTQDLVLEKNRKT